jgi:hypothetical protein
LEALKAEYKSYEKRKWINLGKIFGKTPTGCKNAMKDIGIDC